MKQHNPTLWELLDLIERFFDCSLSDSEESQLRREIAETPYSHPSIDEARAIMGIRPAAKTGIGHKVNETADQATSAGKDRRDIRMPLSIAAAIALLLTLGINLISDTPASTRLDENKCIAYANGRCITDEDDVIRLLTDDLREFDSAVEASDRSFSDELTDIAPIIETYESPADFSDM